MALASLQSRDARPGFTRRTILQAGGAIGGGLLLAVSAPGIRATLAAPEGPPFSPNAFVRIGRDGAVTLIMPQVEMGQGIYTALAMVIAEELDAAFDRVSVEAAPPNDALYSNPALGFQATGRLHLGARFLGADADRGRRQPARCSSKPRRRNGGSSRRRAGRPTAKSSTTRAAERLATANSSTPPPALHRRSIRRSRRRTPSG